MVFSGYMSSSGIAGSYGSSIFSFLRNMAVFLTRSLSSCVNKPRLILGSVIFQSVFIVWLFVPRYLVHASQYMRMSIENRVNRLLNQ